MEKPIDAQKIALYVHELEYKAQKLEEEVGVMKLNTINAVRFYGTTVTTEICAKIHGVCVETVRQYISAGLIPKHPDSTDKKILIRTSDALLLDFKTMKKENKQF